MKRLIFALFALLLLTSIASAQKTEIQNLGTIINSTAGTSANETVFLDLEVVKQKYNWSRVDSVITALYVENETDIDSLDIYPGFRGVKDGATEIAYTTPTTATITLNVADAGTGYQISRGTTGATILTFANLAGYNYIKFVTRGATSGNDATDPNKAWLINYIYGTK